MPKRNNTKVITEKLKTVDNTQHHIFAAAEAKIAREKRTEHIRNNYFLTCVEAKMCPKCGSELVVIEHKTEFHERMMEDEYAYTKINCNACHSLTKVFIDELM